MKGCELRAQLEHEHAARRAAEQACALDFLVYGDGQDYPPAIIVGLPVVGVKHAERCVFGPAHACSRTYDPMPYAEAEPDRALYEGTAIGALYGMPGPEPALEGWELKPRSTHE